MALPACAETRQTDPLEGPRGPAGREKPAGPLLFPSPDGPMRQLIYSVAASLDGYIARPDGAYDWIPDEPDIDWGAFLGRFDTVLMGRRTYEVVTDGDAEEDPTSRLRTVVASRTLDPEDHPDVDVVSDEVTAFVEELLREEGKDVWLMGGGVLFRSLLGAGLVDAVEVALVPALLGDGIPLLPPGEGGSRLELRDLTRYPSGIVLASYEVPAD